MKIKNESQCTFILFLLILKLCLKIVIWFPNEFVWDSLHLIWHSQYCEFRISVCIYSCVLQIIEIRKCWLQLKLSISKFWVFFFFKPILLQFWQKIQTLKYYKPTNSAVPIIALTSEFGPIIWASPKSISLMLVLFLFSNMIFSGWK